MSISTKCPHCRQPYRTPDDLDGREVACSVCKKLFTIQRGESIATLETARDVESAQRPRRRKPEDDEEVYLGGHVSRSHMTQAKKTLLWKEEEMLAMVMGVVKEGSVKGGMFRHYLIVTDKRVIFWARGLIKTTNDAFSFADIQDVEQQRDLLAGNIILKVYGRTIELTRMSVKESQRIRDLIRQKVAEAKDGGRPAGVDPVAQLQKLADLYNQGLLTQQEFEEKKRKLLRKI